MSRSVDDNDTVYIEDDDIKDFNEAITREGVFIKNYAYFLRKKKKVDFSNTDVSKVDFRKMDVSKVTNMTEMFYEAFLFNEPIGHWNVSNVTTMSEIFSQANTFDQPIGKWNVSNVTNMFAMFSDAHSFNQPIGDWDVSKVTDMVGMFYDANKFNQDIRKWDVSKVTDMVAMFCQAYLFNQPIGSWKVSNVTKMKSMFYGAKTFNQPISNWDVSTVTDMGDMFNCAESFNQPIGNWDVSKVTRMYSMFTEAKSFNQPIGDWKVSNVTKMKSMFYKAKTFNQDISQWDVSKVEDIGLIGFIKPLKPLIAYSVYQWYVNKRITKNAAEKIFGSAAKLKKYEQQREAIHGSLPSSRSSPSVKTTLPRSIVHDVIELEEKPISAYKYSPKEDNFPILFADKNDYKVIRSLDLEKVLQDTNNIMYECKPNTPFNNLAIRRDQVRPTAYLQTSVLGIQIASVGVVELSSIQKTIKLLKERMDNNRKQTQKKLSSIKSNKSARKKALLDTKITPYIYKLKAIKGKKLERLASETVLQQKGDDYAVSANHCQNMEPVQVYKLIKVKGKSASKKKSSNKTKSAKSV
jgi:surface protein